MISGRGIAQLGAARRQMGRALLPPHRPRWSPTGFRLVAAEAPSQRHENASGLHRVNRVTLAGRLLPVFPCRTSSGPVSMSQKCPIGDIPMLFNRLSSLRDDQDRREVIYAKNLPRNSPATCLRGIADDVRQRMRQNRKRLPRAGLLQEKRQIERAAETESVPAHARGIRQGHVGEAARISMGSRMTPTVRRDRCAPAQ
jgi:hypothetical protein